MKYRKKSAVVSGLLAVLMIISGATAYAGDAVAGKEKSALCVGCHGDNGIGLSEEFPNLAGQKKAYLAAQLKAFKDRTRMNPAMNAMVAGLSAADIDNLATYYAGLQAGTLVPAASLTEAATSTASKAEFPETVFITMKESASIEVFPAQKIWPGGPNMLYNAVTPDGKVMLATSPSSDSVYAFNAESGEKIAVIAVGKQPKGVKITPDGHYAYISNEGSDEISVLDLQDMKVIDTIKVEKAPHNVRFTSNGKLAYVTLQGGAGIGVIDTGIRQQVRVIPVPGITGPHNIDLSADEKTAYVRDFVHHVAVLELATGKVTRVISVGNGHGGIDVAPNGRYVATAAIGDKFISVINTSDLSVKNIEVGNGPHGIRASKDSRWIYVTVTKDNTVVVVNATTLKVDKKIAVGKFPFWIAVQGNP